MSDQCGQNETFKDYKDFKAAWPSILASLQKLTNQLCAGWGAPCVEKGDVLQEATSRILRSWHRVPVNEGQTAFLARCVYNARIDVAKWGNRGSNIEPASGSCSKTAAKRNESLRRLAGGPSLPPPGMALDLAAALEWLEKVEPLGQKVLNLRFLGPAPVSLAEAARTLGLTSSSARYRQDRAFRLVREAFHDLRGYLG